MGDALGGMNAAGWTGRTGADADHLKTPDDVDRTAAVGFTFFTIDPGDHMDPGADDAKGPQLDAKVADLPWDILQTSAEDLVFGLTRRPLDLDGFSHLYLIYRFHRSQGYSLTVRPFLEDREHGVFATRAPRRG